MKLRSLAIGLALLTTGTIIGVTTQQLASADVTSGDRTVLVPIEPCRLTDTRPAFQVGPRTTPLEPAETVTLDTQQSGTECTGKVPADATAIAANVTAPDSTGESFITLWATGPRPNGSTLNPQPGQLVFNAATIDLDGTNFNIYNNANNVHIIIDITGYYDNHNHDDRYYTKTQTDDAIAAAVEAPVQHTAVTSPTAFRPINPGTAVVAGGGTGAYVVGTDGTSQTLRAPFTLPVGSTIDTVTFHYVDNDPVRNLRLSLVWTGLGSSTQMLVPNINFFTFGSSPSVRQTTLSPGYEVPPDAELSWGAAASTWADVGDLLAVKGVTVTYTLP